MVSVLEERHIMLCNVIINMTSGLTMYDIIVRINLLCFKIVQIYMYNKPYINLIFISSRDAKNCILHSLFPHA